MARYAVMIFVILAGYCRVWEFFSYMICPDCASMMMADVDVICGNPVVAFASDAVAVLVCAASHGIHMLRNSTHTII